ncbi:uncharacterized protein LOC124305566 [Neodiprion virginianus]|uniref:uncharacterized protein LOC124305566 n=1 Tax=Neodiprion virginianus TaxID=2961670 RepID=UPI001EE6E987|nr:uncharacterized protein LOC124305566 [Neodiprion virginianus]
MVLANRQSGTPFLSGHELIYIKYSLRVPKLATRSIRFVNIDDKVTLFNEHVLSTLDTHAPFKTCRPKRQPAPWLSEVIRDRIKERNVCLRAFKKSGSVTLYGEFKAARIRVQLEICEAKSGYYEDLFSALTTPKSLWREFRHLGLCKQRQGVVHADFTTPQLNSHFARIANSACHCTLSPIVLNPESAFDSERFYFKHITPTYLAECLLSSKTEACGCDGIPASYLRLVMQSLIPFVLEIYNYSLTYSFFPLEWKKASIQHINKIKNPTSLDDFRPISILCALCKGIERILYIELTAYLEKCLLDPYQSGFRHGYSSQSALIKLTDDVERAIDNRMMTLIVLFDFRKAFDTVCHAKLLDKLKALNCSASVVEWFKSYLSDRRQAVKGSDGDLSS